MTFTEYPIVFWFCAVPAVLFIGLAKGGFGAGAVILATPLLTLAIPVTHAVGLLLPLLIMTDMIALMHYRRHFDSRSIKMLVPSACLGVTAGALFFGYFSGSMNALRFIIGVVSLSFVLFQVLRTLILGAMAKHRPTVLEGILMGATAGFTSTMAHAGGPPVLMYLLPQKLEKSVFVGSMAIFFASVNLAKLLPYHILGLLYVGDTKTILTLAPLTFMGVRLGVYLNKRFSDIWFNRIIYSVLFITGIQLILGQNLLGLIFNVMGIKP